MPIFGGHDVKRTNRNDVIASTDEKVLFVDFASNSDRRTREQQSGFKTINNQPIADNHIMDLIQERLGEDAVLRGKKLQPKSDADISGMYQCKECQTLYNTKPGEFAIKPVCTNGHNPEMMESLGRFI